MDEVGRVFALIDDAVLKTEMNHGSDIRINIELMEH